MTGSERKPLSAWSIPFKIVFLYAIVGLLYIFFSDILLEIVVADPVMRAHISMYKGMFYVFVTAVLLYFMIHHYLSKLRRSGEKLRESEQRGFTFFEKSHSVVLLVDSETADIVDANARACAFYGYKKQALLGMKVWNLHAFDHEEIRAEVEAAAAGQKNLMFFTHRVAGGELRDVEVHSAPILLHGKKVLYTIIHDISDRKRAEQALKDSEERFRKQSLEFQGLLDTIPDALISLSPDLKIHWVNSATYQMLKRGLPSLSGAFCHGSWYGRTEPCKKCLARECLQSGKPEAGLVETSDGKTYELRVVPVRDESGAISSIVEMSRDITDQKRMEEQLLQSHKLEAVGRLAGGVAHDFNNLLTIILGYGDLLLARMEEDDPRRMEVEEILKVGHHAAVLTRQLLALSRRQVLQPVVIDLNRVIRELETMLRRLIGKGVDLAISLEERLGRVKVDPVQLERVVVNLAVNACDAMLDGGKLSIRTASIIADSEITGSYGIVPPGSYILFEVRDNGCGMDPQTITRIFEPFFTTKGKGTGLGLFTVYSIVKQSDGYVTVESEPGKGTTFRVYLPRVEESVMEPAVVPEVSSADAHSVGKERVLLVTSSEELRELIRKVLEQRGYAVLQASGGSDAIRLCSGNEGNIDLILVDVVMPGMSGRELWEKLAPMHSGVKVLYMSGYTDDDAVRRGLLDTGTAYIQKPFMPDTLARKVRETLNSGRGDG